MIKKAVSLTRSFRGRTLYTRRIGMTINQRLSFTYKYKKETQ